MIELGKACRPLLANDLLTNILQQRKVLGREFPAPLNADVSFTQHSADRFSRPQNGLNMVGSSRENRDYRKSQSRSSTTGPTSLLILL